MPPINMNKIGNNATIVRVLDDFISVRLYSTIIVEVTDFDICLRTGGYATRTTTNRMNQTSNQYDLGYKVFKRKGQMFVNYKGKNIPFNENNFVELKRKGS